ncbi:TRAP transporter substrate-binding protein [Alteribacillus sp. YIM 98480]|uniref:TRAP transporter substrate-binding protein n=1 Tax=Alteribacillus sp. YIM 98480 TaxID=2606599 RepID=UPI00131C1A81|nr:TRAP transporter substrate-binding protein [Alteribacillus sp. YIM 98480]
MKTLTMFIFTVILLFISACSSGEMQESSGETDISDLPETELRLGHNAPPESPTGQAADKLAEIVEENSEGNITIEVYPENQLGDNRDLIEQTSVGGLDLSMAGLGVLGDLAPEYNFMQIPFLFESQDHIHKVVESDIGEELAEQLVQEHDLRLLTQSWDRLPRQVSANKQITSPEDLNGFLIRTGTKGATETFSILGAKPTSVPLKEVYLSLQNNIIEGVELPPDYMVTNSVAEVNSHLNMTNHTYGTQFIAMNEMIFNELPEQYKTIINEAVQEAGNYNNELTEEETGEYLEDLEENGMEIVELSDEDREKFTSTVQENIEELEQVWPEAEGLGERILNTK